jgi:hypothetical protein
VQRAAPAASNAAASALTVAPVVNTSSTIASRSPQTLRRTSNAAATLARRAAALCAVCDALPPMRSTPR